MPTGKIFGTVSDEQGTPLPGVTIEATSPKLLGKGAAVSDENGVYRLFALTPGLYKVTFALQGFKTVTREGIIVEVEESVYGVRGQGVAFEFVDEVQVKASGYQAEYGGSRKIFPRRRAWFRNTFAMPSRTSESSPERTSPTTWRTRATDIPGRRRTAGG